MDALSLYETLEDKVIPMYYENRDENGIPQGWMTMVKNAIRTLSPEFSMRRMVAEYADRMYIPSIQEQ